MKEAPKKVPKKKFSKDDVLAIILMVLWTFVSVVASQLVVEIAMSAILGEAASEPIWNGVYSLLSYVIAIVLIIEVPPRVARKWNISTVFISHKRASRESLGLNGTPTWTDIGLSPIAFIISTLLAGVLDAAFTIFPWYNVSEAQDVGFNTFMTSSDKVIAFFALVVLAPIAEEIIFRGWLYGKLRTRLSAVWSVLIVSVLFGIVHFQWNVGVNVFALSVVLCLLREVSGTIYSGILTHMVKNGVAFYLLYVMVV